MAMAPHVFCTDCGTQNKFTSNFCFKCGNALQKEVVNNNRHPDTISKSSANHPQSSCSAPVADSSNSNGNSSALGRETTQKKRQNISGYKYSTCKKGHDLESIDVKKRKKVYGSKYNCRMVIECNVCELRIQNGAHAFHCDECDFDKCKRCWMEEKNEGNEEEFTMKMKIDNAPSTNPRRSSRIANTAICPP
eukprot:443643_1